MTRNCSISLQECAGENLKEQEKKDKNIYIIYMIRIKLRDNFGKLTSISSVTECRKSDLKSQFSEVTCIGKHWKNYMENSREEQLLLIF